MPKIVRVIEDEWSGLCYNDRGYYDEEQLLPLGQPTAAEYAILCDDDAVNKNFHDFNGVHKALLVILEIRLKTDDARTIIRDIAEAGGLHALE